MDPLSKRHRMKEIQFEAFKLKDGKSWKDSFGVYVDERPNWSGKGVMCPRWNVRGYCFTNCRNVESHVPKDKVPTDKEKAFGVWMKKVCAAR